MLYTIVGSAYGRPAVLVKAPLALFAVAGQQYLPSHAFIWRQFAQQAIVHEVVCVRFDPRTRSFFIGLLM